MSHGINDIVKEQTEKLEHLKNYSFAEFRKQFSRAYEPGAPEFIKRQKIFKKNLQFLIQHNEGPVKTYMLAVNKFMDYTEDEFQKLLGYKRGAKSMGASSFLQQAPPQW